MNSLPLSGELPSTFAPRFPPPPESWPAEFLRACGESPSRRMALFEGDVPAGEFELNQPYLIVGRSAECDIVLNQCEVSSRHLYLQPHGRRILWFDLASLNGVRERSKRRDYGEFTSSKPLRLGPFSLRLLPAVAPQGPPALQVFHGSFNEDDLADVHLKVLNGPDVGTVRRLKNPVTLLGRSQICPLRLKHESIARVHCSLVRTPSGVWIINLHGGHGLTVDGARVHCARLSDGCELRVGEFQFEVQSCSAQRPESAVSASRPTLPHALIAAPMVPGLPRVSSPLALPPAGGNTIALPTGAQASEMVPQSLIFDLLREFMAMQQQMFEQSQQTMMMMAQMFGSLYQEQMQSLREEMRQVRELTVELQELQRQYATLEATRNPAGAGPALPLVAESQGSPAPSGGDDLTCWANASPRLVDSSLDAVPADPVAILGARDDSVPGGGRDSAETSAPSAGVALPPDQDPHAWLSGRIAEITHERNGRWEKMMSLFLCR